jgi:hypothetical protein
MGSHHTGVVVMGRRPHAGSDSREPFVDEIGTQRRPDRLDVRTDPDPVAEDGKGRFGFLAGAEAAP